MKRFGILALRIFAYLLVAPVLALETSHSSTIIEMGQSDEQIETIGKIRYLGFPVWFIDAAPGKSIMSSWNYDRFFINTGIWLLIYIGVLGVADWTLVNRKKKRQSNMSLH